ncbi:MAG: ATP-binding protein [Actinomycetota bacterium]|nr:ATP-binding protein [Actinomycetota bacterium]
MQVQVQRVRAQRSFEPRPDQVGAARSFVAGALAEAGTVSPDVALLVSELATNAVLHARTRFAVEVLVEDDGDHLRVGVTDLDARLPILGGLDPDASGGRGIALVRALADAWGVHCRAGSGKTVWFELTGSRSLLAC